MLIFRDDNEESSLSLLLYKESLLACLWKCEVGIKFWVAIFLI